MEEKDHLKVVVFRTNMERECSTVFGPEVSTYAACLTVVQLYLVSVFMLLHSHMLWYRHSEDRGLPSFLSQLQVVELIEMSQCG